MRRQDADAARGPAQGGDLEGRELLAQYQGRQVQEDQVADSISSAESGGHRGVAAGARGLAEDHSELRAAQLQREQRRGGTQGRCRALRIRPLVELQARRPWAARALSQDRCVARSRVRCGWAAAAVVAVRRQRLPSRPRRAGSLASSRLYLQRSATAGSCASSPPCSRPSRYRTGCWRARRQVRSRRRRRRRRWSASSPPSPCSPPRAVTSSSTISTAAALSFSRAPSAQSSRSWRVVALTLALTPSLAMAAALAMATALCHCHGHGTGAVPTAQARQLTRHSPCKPTCACTRD